MEDVVEQPLMFADFYRISLCFGAIPAPFTRIDLDNESVDHKLIASRVAGHQLIGIIYADGGIEAAQVNDRLGLTATIKEPETD